PAVIPPSITVTPVSTGGVVFTPNLRLTNPGAFNPPVQNTFWQQQPFPSVGPIVPPYPTLFPQTFTPWTTPTVLPLTCNNPFLNKSTIAPLGFPPGLNNPYGQSAWQNNVNQMLVNTWLNPMVPAFNPWGPFTNPMMTPFANPMFANPMILPWGGMMGGMGG